MAATWVVWKDEFGTHRAKVVEFGGELGMEVRWTDSCSGCFEFNEGLGLDRYQFDSKAGIYLGHGCEECGYTGKRRQVDWVPLPNEAVVRLRERGLAAEE